MHSYEEFKDYIVDGIHEFFADKPGNFSFSIDSMNKFNGVQRDGLMIREEGKRAAPIFYLDDAYKMYESGVSEEEIMQSFADRYDDSSFPVKGFDADAMEDWNNVKDNVFFRLCNADMNWDMLNEIPHKDMGDFAAIYYVTVPGNDEMRAKVSNRLFEKYDVSLDELHETAVANMERDKGVMLRGMEDVMRDLMGDIPIPQEKTGFYVLGDWKYGAASVMLPSIQDELAEKFGDCYMIPSSVHEWLVLPVTDNVDANHLQELIMDVNERVLDPGEVLSDSLYHYDGSTGELEKVEEIAKENDIGIGKEPMKNKAKKRDYEPSL